MTQADVDRADKIKPGLGKAFLILDDLINKMGYDIGCTNPVDRNAFNLIYNTLCPEGSDVPQTTTKP